jgi:hypothetical protein
MDEKPGKDELRSEVERGNFERAALLAASLDVPEEEIQELRLEALWRMSAVYRNAPGTERLARDYGISKEALREFLVKRAEEQGKQGNRKPLEPCYDLSTGRHLSFEEWMDRLLKKWEKLSVS